MTATCLCGNVELRLESPPEFIHDCNCTLCRKSGGAWGYYTAKQIRIMGETTAVRRTDIDAKVDVHSCRACGATTHVQAIAGQDLTKDPDGWRAVNMRLFDSLDLVGVEVRYPNGRAWSGDGAFDYRKPSIRIEAPSDW